MYVDQTRASMGSRRHPRRLPDGVRPQHIPRRIRSSTGTAPRTGRSPIGRRHGSRERPAKTGVAKTPPDRVTASQAAPRRLHFHTCASKAARRIDRTASAPPTAAHRRAAILGQRRWTPPGQARPARPAGHPGESRSCGIRVPMCSGQTATWIACWQPDRPGPLAVG